MLLFFQRKIAPTKFLHPGNMHVPYIVPYIRQDKHEIIKRLWWWRDGWCSG